MHDDEISGGAIMKKAKKLLLFAGLCLGLLLMSACGKKSADSGKEISNGDVNEEKQAATRQLFVKR